MWIDNPIPGIITTKDFSNIELILTLAFLWFILYKLVSLMIGGAKSPAFQESKIRVVGIIHSCVAMTFATMDIFGHRAHFNQKNTFFQKTVVDISLAFSITHITIRLSNKLLNPATALYIITEIIAFGWASFSRFGATSCIVGLFITQISAIPFNMSKIMEKFMLVNTALFELFEVWHTTLYMIIGIMLGPWLLVNAMRNKNNPLPVVIIAGLLNAMNLVKFSFLVDKIKAKVVQYNERREKSVKLWWIDENPEVRRLEYVKEKKEKTL